MSHQNFMSPLFHVLVVLAVWSIAIFGFAGGCFMDPWPCETGRPWSLLAFLLCNVLYSVSGLSCYLSTSTVAGYVRKPHMVNLILALVSSTGLEFLAERIGWPLGVSGCDGATTLRVLCRVAPYLLLPHIFVLASLEFVPPGPRTTAVVGWATHVFRRCCPEGLLRRRWSAIPDKEQKAKHNSEKLPYRDDPDASGR